MRNPLHSWTVKSVLCFALSFAATGIASAQAMVAAQRGAEITPFASTTLLSPDWGPTRNMGFTMGVDYTRFIRSIVQPSLEVRFTSANGTTVNEHSYAGGIKLQGPSIHGVTPYATLLAGTGTITFVHPSGNYYGDNSFIYAIGGGAEVHVLPAWKIRADFSQQQWNLDPHQLTPIAMSVGISYSIPFHSGGWVH